MIFGNSYLLASALFRFYWELINSFIAPYRPDLLTLNESAENHPHYRRFTKRYMRKRGLVKSLWIVAGVIFLINPVIQLIAVVALFTTCLSFAILDETP